MAAEEFFARWAKKRQQPEAADTPADTGAAATGQRDASQVSQTGQSPQDQQVREDVPPLPTMEDVARLTHDSDYSPFMAKGVDEAVKRSAMKKLFSDPHFNIMDGLDVYIEDFTKCEPITPAMLASLEHAKELLNPRAGTQAALMRLIDPPEQQDRPANEEAADDAAGAKHAQAHDFQAQVQADASQQMSDAGEADPPDKDEAMHTEDKSADARKADEI